MDHWKGSTRAAWLSMYTHLPVSQYLWSVSTPSSFSKNDPPPCAAALEGSTLHHSHKETEYEEQPHANIYGRTVWLIQTEKAIYAKLIQALLTQRAALQWWKKNPSLWWKSPYFHLKSILRDVNIFFWGMVKRWAHSPRVPFVKKKKKKKKFKAGAELPRLNEVLILMNEKPHTMDAASYYVTDIFVELNCCLSWDLERQDRGAAVFGPSRWSGCTILHPEVKITPEKLLLVFPHTHFCACFNCIYNWFLLLSVKSLGLPCCMKCGIWIHLPHLKWFI